MYSGAVDQQRREVDRREPPPPEQAERHERVRPAGHEDRERDERDGADRERHPGDRVLPVAAPGRGSPRTRARRPRRSRRPRPASRSRPSRRSARLSATWRRVANRARMTSGHVDQERRPPASRCRPAARRRSARSGSVADGRGRPDADRAGPRGLVARTVAVMIASDPGTSSAPGRALEQPDDDQQLERRREAAQDGRDAEPDRGRSRTRAAGRSSRRGRRRAGAARRGSRGSRRRRRSGPRASRRGWPAARARCAAAPGSRPCRRGRPWTCRGSSRASSSAGTWSPVSLSCVVRVCQGSDRGVQPGPPAAPASPDRTSAACSMLRPCPDPWRSSAPESSSRRWQSSTAGCSQPPAVARPRVVVLPTAAAPDGEATFRVWAEMGVEHFSAARRRGRAGPRARRRARATTRPPCRRSARPTSSTSRAATRAHLLAVLRDSPLGAAIRGRQRPRRGGRRVLGRRDGDRRPDGRLPVPAQAPDADAVPGPLAGRARRWSTASPCCRTTTPGPSRSPRSSRSRRRAAA